MNVDRPAIEESRWDDTLAALASVKSGKLIDGDRVSEWLQSWGTDEEISPPAPKPPAPKTRSETPGRRVRAASG
jgi:hypothetical protein